MNSKRITDHQLKRSVEALLFISGEGLSLKETSLGLGEPQNKIKNIFENLMYEYSEREGGFFIERQGEHYQFKTNPSTFQTIRLFLREIKKEKLSRSTLETLAIVAYKQPVTQSEIDELRGVKSRTLLASLISKNLVRPSGYKRTVGKPTLYRTTKTFLNEFGLGSLKDLPELKEVKYLDIEEL